MKITSKSLIILRFFQFFLILLKYLIAYKKVEIASKRGGGKRFAQNLRDFQKNIYGS